MARAYDVARYLVWLAANEEEPDYLTPPRLQKLLYYVQGWSLAQRGAEMFPERIEAWAHGPVVRDLFPEFTRWGRLPILPDAIDAEGEIDLTDEEKEFINQVWATYRAYSAWSLREMTHQEAPWVEARKGLGPEERCDEEITPQAMREFFSVAVE